MRVEDEQFEPDKAGGPSFYFMEEAVPGYHGDHRLLWASSIEKVSEQKRWQFPSSHSAQTVRWQ